MGFAIEIYLLCHWKKSKKTQKKIDKAKKYGLYEPVSIHPYVDPAKCIGSGACVKACPEKDILGLVKGKAALINASLCIGHGACAAACPVGAITLVFGTETRGVDIPYITPNFETNVRGIFIVGELGGMGLIRNAVTQGREVVDYISCFIKENERAEKALFDTVIVGAGPSGISASLAAFKYKLKFLTVEQSDIGGTILHYPRHKIVMTSPMDLPMYGKIKLKETTKEALLDLFIGVIKKTGLKININEKMTELRQENGYLRVITAKGEYLTKTAVLAIGRRGTPRKLGVLGENLSKVTYRLLDPEQHKNQNLLVVGGGDSAVEAAMSLSCQLGNNVVLSYRGDAFGRIKPMNKQRLDEAISKNLIKILFNSNLKEIKEKDVKITVGEEIKVIQNDYVYIFAGGELPNEFLTKIGVKIEKKFGKG